MDRVQLHWEHGIDRQRRWRHGNSGSWDASTVTFGQLADGRWYAERTGQLADPLDRREGALVFDADEAGRAAALQAAYQWMADGGWQPIPAAYGPDGLPTDGLPWKRSGADWYLER